MSDKDVPYSKQWEAEIAEYQDAKRDLALAELGLRQKFAPIVIEAERNLDLKTLQDVIMGLPIDFYPVSHVHDAAARVKDKLIINGIDK